MLHFFLWYPPSAFGFGTILSGFTNEVVLAIICFTYVLVVPLGFCEGLGLGGFPIKALLLRGFGCFHGIFLGCWVGCVVLIWVF